MLGTSAAATPGVARRGDCLGQTTHDYLLANRAEIAQNEQDYETLLTSSCIDHYLGSLRQFVCAG